MFGLATLEQLQNVTDKENEMIKFENQLSAKLKQVNTQTNDILDTIQAQNSKLSTLYTDEVEIKSSIRSLLSDTSNAITLINQLTAALEVYSDVSLEFSTFMSLLDLMPSLIYEIQDSILALTTQSVTSSLIDADTFHKLVPINTRASLLSSHVTAKIQGMKFNIILTTPELHPPFTVYHFYSIPIGPNQNMDYTILNITSPLVAINNMQVTFNYNPHLCPIHNTITICPSHVIRLYSTPINCEQALLVNDNKFYDLCIKAIILAKPKRQSFIYTDNLKKVRVFSPFPDKITQVCGTEIKQNISDILVGYNDFTFNSLCFIKTSQMTILSPTPPEDSTDMYLKREIPNLDESFSKLESDIELTHNVNLTAMHDHFDSLSKFIDHETIDIKNVQNELQKSMMLHKLANYTPGIIDFEKPDPLTTNVAVTTWLIGIVILAISFVCCRIFAPTAFRAFFKALGATIADMFCCLFSCCGRMYQNRQQIAAAAANVLPAATSTLTRQRSNSTSVRFETPVNSEESLTFLNNPRPPPAVHQYSTIAAPPNIRSTVLRTALNPVTQAIDYASAPPPPLNSSNQYNDDYYLSPNSSRLVKSPSTIALNNLNTWIIVTKPDRITLQIATPEGRRWYDSYTREVVDSMGISYTDIAPPSQPLIGQYFKQISKLSPPELILEAGLLRVKSDLSIFFDKAKNQFVSGVTRRPVDGFKIPDPKLLPK